MMLDPPLLHAVGTIYHSLHCLVPGVVMSFVSNSIGYNLPLLISPIILHSRVGPSIDQLAQHSKPKGWLLSLVLFNKLFRQLELCT